jgi:putative RNA 2'-phosphotransferase
MDEYGFVALEEIARAVRERYEDLGEEDIRKLIEEPDQHRFEITEKGIRALYGHSFFVEMDGEPMEPPEHLYMWCTVNEARRFGEQGVKPKDRFYVHLSLSRQTAEARGKRVDAPCVVEVLARKAHAAGIAFYGRGEVVLTSEVPPEFIGEISALETPEAAKEERPESPASMSFGRRLRKGTRRGH